MKNLPIILLLFAFLGFKPAENAKTVISLNSAGFLPDMPKKATLTGQAASFALKNATDGKVVYKHEVTGPAYQKDIEQQVWFADFSDFSKEGKYYIELPNGSRSIDFRIAPDVYNQDFNTTMRAFYLWRCGTAVSGDYQGDHFGHGPCHLDDGYEYYAGKPDVKRDGTGGWHDAGDYGKYTVNAGFTLGMLFMAWDQYQDKLNNISLDLPETAAGYPDFLKELKWETDWLLKMPYPDHTGRVSHKLTRKNFSPFISADEDHAKRFFTDWGSAATADFAASMAQAARYFKPWDAAYAQQCLDAALTSYNYLKQHPEYKRFEQGEFKTGGYQTKDGDDRLWAAAELWETTGDKSYLEDFEKQAAAMNYQIDEDWDWTNVSNMGMFTYLLSSREGKDPETVKNLRNNTLKVANDIVQKSSEDVYGRPLGSTYYWGCNGTVARQVINLQVANKLSPDPQYLHTALDALGHLFGRNYYNRSFVTGIGIQPPMHPHDRRSGADNVVAPWPGYLVGGGRNATNWQDKQADYTTNEIAINWQGALVYALAGFVDANE